MINILQALADFFGANKDPAQAQSSMSPGMQARDKLAVSTIFNNFVSPQSPEQAFPSANIPAPISNPIPTPTPTPPRKGQPTTSTPTSEAFLRDVILPILQQYQIPNAVGAGQFAAEGRLGGMGADRNNYYNIGGYDSNPGGMPTYANPQEGVAAYAKLLSTDPRYAAAYALRTNPESMMLAIQNANYAGDPTTYQQRNGDNPYPSYSSFVEDTPEWKKYYAQ
jgi:hypothetical protein